MVYCDSILAKSLLKRLPSIFASWIVGFVVIQLYKDHKYAVTISSGYTHTCVHVVIVPVERTLLVHIVHSYPQLHTAQDFFTYLLFTQTRSDNQHVGVVVI